MREYNEEQNSERENAQVRSTETASGGHTQSIGHSDTKKVSSKALHQFIHEKVGKLTTALYMVTAYMKSDEPIRHTLRSSGVKLVSYSSSLSQDTLHDQLLYLQKDMNEIITLLEVSSVMSLISPMNAEILLTEYRALQTVLERERVRYEGKQLTLSVPHEAVFYGQTLETIEDKNLQGRLLSTVSERDVRGSTSFERVSSRSAENRTVAESPRVSIKNISESVRGEDIEGKATSAAMRSEMRSDTALQAKTLIHSTGVAPTKRAITFPEIKERRVSRRAQVLSLLSKNDPQSIKEIALRIKGCSEKTVQRELNDLLANKEIKRIGEKRWSKYILAK